MRQEKTIDDSNLSPEQLDEINFGRKLRKAGISSDEDIAEFMRWREAKNKAKKPGRISSSSKEVSSQRTLKMVNDDSSHDNQLDQRDSDEYSRPAVNLEKVIERAKENSEAELEQIARLEELQKVAEQSEKYTYGWFKALLELEIMSRNESSFGTKEISISFSLVEREPETERTLILKHPNRYIPQFMEDLSDIPLELHIGKEKHTVAIEVVNIRSYSLRVKLRANAEIDGIDLSKVTEARIKAKDPSFLLEKLRDGFAELVYDDKFNMQQNLCKILSSSSDLQALERPLILFRRLLCRLLQSRNR